jgi:uncharacterized membrane protein
LIIGAALAVAAIALAISQNWRAFANLVPLRFMLACAVMMLKYMKGHHSPTQATRQLTPARRFTG